MGRRSNHPQAGLVSRREPMKPSSLSAPTIEAVLLELDVGLDSSSLEKMFHGQPMPCDVVWVSAQNTRLVFCGGTKPSKAHG